MRGYVAATAGIAILRGMSGFTIVLGLMVSHVVVWAVGFLVGHDRARQRTNREWLDERAKPKPKFKGN